jgi:hypothetical protein
MGDPDVYLDVFGVCYTDPVSDNNYKGAYLKEGDMEKIAKELKQGVEIEYEHLDSENPRDNHKYVIGKSKGGWVDEKTKALHTRVGLYRNTPYSDTITNKVKKRELNGFSLSFMHILRKEDGRYVVVDRKTKELSLTNTPEFPKAKFTKIVPTFNEVKRDTTNLADQIYKLKQSAPVSSSSLRSRVAMSLESSSSTSPGSIAETPTSDAMATEVASPNGEANLAKSTTTNATQSPSANEEDVFKIIASNPKLSEMFTSFAAIRQQNDELKKQLDFVTEDSRQAAKQQIIDTLNDFKETIRGQPPSVEDQTTIKFLEDLSNNPDLLLKDREKKNFFQMISKSSARHKMTLKETDERIKQMNRQLEDAEKEKSLQAQKAQEFRDLWEGHIKYTASGLSAPPTRLPPTSNYQPPPQPTPLNTTPVPSTPSPAPTPAPTPSPTQQKQQQQQSKEEEMDDEQVIQSASSISVEKLEVPPEIAQALNLYQKLDGGIHYRASRPGATSIDKERASKLAQVRSNMHGMEYLDRTNPTIYDILTKKSKQKNGRQQDVIPIPSNY